LIFGNFSKLLTGTLDPQDKGVFFPSRVITRLLPTHGHICPASVQKVLYTSEFVPCFIADEICGAYPNKVPVYSRKTTCKEHMFRLFKWRRLCAMWR